MAFFTFWTQWDWEITWISGLEKIYRFKLEENEQYKIQSSLSIEYSSAYQIKESQTYPKICH